MRRLSATAAIVVLGVLVFTPGAQACSCAPMTPARAMHRADAAIVGRLVEVVPRNRVKADYRYRVQRVYKRGQGIRRGRVISVRSARQSAACALPHRTGRRYGLFLLRAEGRWTSGLCGVVRPGLLGSTAARLSDCAS
ncbi:MAG TPA: hypothetical protein VF085_00255 [Solirubrobacterales bacterium]